MCKSCWEDKGSPRIDNPGVRAAVGALQAVHGDLPPLLDDYNVEDHDLEDDIATAQKWIDSVWTEGYALRIIHAINFLRPLTPEERISVLACVDELWELP